MLLPFLKKDGIGLDLLFVDVLREVISEEYAIITGVLNTVDGQISQPILKQVNPAFSALFLHWQRQEQYPELGHAQDLLTKLLQWS